MTTQTDMIQPAPVVCECDNEPITEEIRSIIEEWKGKEGNLIMIFHAIQDYYGYVPRNVSMWVSDELNIPLARIYEIVTFYNFFSTEPPAKINIAVCTGTACFLKGSPKLIETFKSHLGIKEKYSPDRTYRVEEVRCLGCCGLAPVVSINGDVFGKVTPEKIPEIILETTKKYQESEIRR